MIPIFAFVGVIEVISIAFRPVSLSLRLFGNIYAGENLMHTMSDELGETMGFPTALSFLMKVIVPIPFYFLELLVGVVQALVFTLLVRGLHQADDLARRSPRRGARRCPRPRGGGDPAPAH